jgi:microcompartment protein CcmL/EutN
MTKNSEVGIITATSVCPGKYIVIVHGDVASVEDSVKTGEECAGEFYVDSIIIPNVHERVFPAIAGTEMPGRIDAVGIVEYFSLPAILTAADAILKSAALEPIELRLGSGLGGKAYFVFTGEVSAVQAGVQAACALSAPDGLLVNAEIIPAPSEKIVEFLL